VLEKKKRKDRCGLEHPGRDLGINQIRKNKAGYSLIEILFGLFLTGLLLSLSGYAFHQLIPRYRLASAVQHVANDMQLARMKAIGQNCYYRLQLSPKENTYLLERESIIGQSRWPGVQDGLSRKFSQPGNPYHCPGVTLESSTSHPVFSPRGNVAGTTIILKNAVGRKIITLSSQGRVKVQEG
jgi:Tfp pilus assembly protein FimT